MTPISEFRSDFVNFKFFTVKGKEMDLQVDVANLGNDQLFLQYEEARRNCCDIARELDKAERILCVLGNELVNRKVEVEMYCAHKTCPVTEEYSWAEEDDLLNNSGRECNSANSGTRAELNSLLVLDDVR